MIHKSTALLRAERIATIEEAPIQPGYAVVATERDEYRATTLHDAMVMWAMTQPFMSNQRIPRVLRVSTVG